MITWNNTWNEAKEWCSNQNLTLMAPDTQRKTVKLGYAIHFHSLDWQDVAPDSFERYWLGYREIDGEWVIKLEPVKTSNSKYKQSFSLPQTIRRHLYNPALSFGILLLIIKTHLNVFMAVKVI